MESLSQGINKSLSNIFICVTIYTIINISDITRAKFFWEDKNCAWYLETSEGNTNLAWGNFRQDGKVDATLDFWRKLTHEFLVNLIGVNKDNEYVINRYLRTFRMPKKVHAGSQRLQNIVGYGFTSKKNGAKSNKTRKKKVHELSRVQK